MSIPKQQKGSQSNLFFNAPLDTAVKAITPMNPPRRNMIRAVFPDVLGTICGTPEYMAPEVLLGKAYSCAVDMWSLGCVCFELSTGRSPYATNSADETMRRAISGMLEVPPSMPDDTIAFVSALFEPRAKKFLKEAEPIMYIEHKSS